MQCLNCKFAEWKKTAAGRLHPSGEGKCAYPFLLPQIPAAFFWVYIPAPSGGYMNRKKELKKKCSLYQEKDGENGKKTRIRGYTIEESRNKYKDG